MRRPAAALLGTVAGTILLVGAKYGTAPPAADAANSVAAGDAGPGGPPSGGDAPGAEPPNGSAAPGPATAGTGQSPTPPGRTPATKAAGHTSAPGQPTSRPPANPPASTCATDTGGAARVSSPGVGNITVSVRVCGSTVTSATSSQSRSNWDTNSAALPALNTLAVKYYKTDISKIHYSGATLTSNAYQASLRSALSEAGL